MPRELQPLSEPFSVFYYLHKIRRSSGNGMIGPALTARSIGDCGRTKRRDRAMWISLFTLASAAAVALSVAAVLMQTAKWQPLRR